MFYVSPFYWEQITSLFLDIHVSLNIGFFAKRFSFSSLILYFFTMMAQEESVYDYRGENRERKAS
jgi:hypothetical protein